MNFKSTAVLLLFVAIMLFTASCGKAEPSSSNPENTTAAAPESTSYYDTLGIPMYSGQKFTILCQTGSVGEIYAEAETGEVVNDAIYAANRSVEEHLGLDLGVLLVDGGWSNRKVFMESVSSSIMAGTDDFQMLMGYMNYMPTLILEHMFLKI